MSICPRCGHQNIDGVDVCEQCESSLSALSKPRPGSKVERSIMKDRVAQVASRKPLVVSPETPVGEVLARLAARNRGCAVVVSNHEVIGIFTERDALFRLNVDTPELSARPIEQFMTSPVETLEHDDRLAFALHKMDLGGYRHLPILLEGQITGILSVRDILNHITESLESE